MTLLPISQGPFSSEYTQYQRALLRQYDRAFGWTEPLVGAADYLSPGWLMIHPTFVPFRGEPRFERLVRCG